MLQPVFFLFLKIGGVASSMSSSCFYDGNRVEYTRLKKPVKRKATVTVVPAGAAPPSHVRRRRKQDRNVLHLSIERDGGKKRERWTRVSRLLERKVKVLEGSGLKPGVGNYSEDEDAAIKRRKTGGEAYSSIARSLGRSEQAVTNRGQRLNESKVRADGPRKGRRAAGPEHQLGGRSHQRDAAAAQPAGHRSRCDCRAEGDGPRVLDESRQPGSSNSRGFGTVIGVLTKSRYPQFAALPRPARLGQSGTVVQVTQGRKGHEASVQFQDGAVEAFSVGSLALAASPAARRIAAGASVTVTKEEGGVVKVEAGPRNRPCTVYKYRPELTPVKAVKSPAKAKWLNAKERKKGYDGVAQKNG